MHPFRHIFSPISLLFKHTAFNTTMHTPLSSNCRSLVRRSPRIASHNSCQRQLLLSSSPHNGSLRDDVQVVDLYGSTQEPVLSTARRIEFHNSKPVSAPSSVDVAAPIDDTDTVNFCDIGRECGGIARSHSSDMASLLDLTTTSAPHNDVTNRASDVFRAQSAENEIHNNLNSPQGAVLLPLNSAEGEIRASEANELTCAYNYLSKLNVKEMRQLLRDWNLKQAGNKSTLVARALSDIQKAILGGRTVQQAMSSHRITARYEAWVKQQVTLDLRSPRHWKLAPSESELFGKLEVRETAIFTREKINLLPIRDGLTSIDDQRPPSAYNAHGRDVDGSSVQRNVGSSSESTVFSISEFARLCIVMRGDEDAKAAFAGIGQELNRSQLDAGFTRESYWGIIEERFNDPRVQLHLNMVGNVDDVDSKLRPPIHRSASFLKDKFFDARSSFTICLNNWSKSGQNDYKDFKKFAGCRNGSLSAEGKRNLVMFVCGRIGTEQEDTRFSNMCTRVISFNRGCDEGGRSSQRTNGSPRRISRLSRSSGKASNHEETPFERSMMDYSSISIGYKREKAIALRERREEASRKRLREGNVMNKELAEKASFVKQMGALHEQMKGNEVDPGEAYAQCAKQYMQELREAFLSRRPDRRVVSPSGDDGDIEDTSDAGAAARTASLPVQCEEGSFEDN